MTLSVPSEPGLVKSCPKLESGLRLGQEGIHACQLGPFSSPIYWTAEEAANTKITREMIVEKRKWIFELLNDDHSETPCKHCHMVVKKPLGDVRFDKLGHIDLAATTTCNLRCNFCGYTHFDSFADAKYDALEILRLFSPEDIVWDAAVDFNGGEPTLLKDFDAYIDYFSSRRIRVFLFTNGVIYRQSVYDALQNGTIRWACISLDAGAPTTYDRIKKSKRYFDVLENIARYSEAGSRGGGQVSVKYIFCQDNCGDDDIAGFSYAMLALRPQEVWLTFDFDPICNLPGDCADFGGHDYSPHVTAYAKTFVMMQKHGLVPIHYPDKHLAVVSLQGKLLVQAAKEQITELSSKKPRVAESALLTKNFRNPGARPGQTAITEFALSPARIRRTDREPWQPTPLAGKRIALAPMCALARQVRASADVTDAQVVGYFDRDLVLHGKIVDGVTVAPYAAIAEHRPELIIVAAPEHLRADITHAIFAAVGSQIPIAIYIPETENCHETIPVELNPLFAINKSPLQSKATYAHE